MHALVTLVLALVALVTVGIPLAAVAVVYREELLPLLGRAGRALAFDPRHPALDYHAAR